MSRLHFTFILHSWSYHKSPSQILFPSHLFLFVCHAPACVLGWYTVSAVHLNSCSELSPLTIHKALHPSIKPASIINVKAVNAKMENCGQGGSSQKDQIVIYDLSSPNPLSPKCLLGDSGLILMRHTQGYNVGGA